MLGFVKRWTFPVIFGVIGVVAPHNLFGSVVGPAVTLVGLMIAGILPAATLTVNAMKPGLSVMRLNQLRSALRWQILRWVSIFFAAIGCGLVLISGAALSWSLPIWTFPAGWQIGSVASVDFSFVFTASALFLVGYILFNVGSVFSGILRILDLLHELAVAEAQAKADDLAQSVQLEIKSMPDRPGFGSYVEH